MKKLINTILKRPAPGFMIEQNEAGWYRANHPDIQDLFWYYSDPEKTFRKAVWNSWFAYEMLERNKENQQKQAQGWKQV